MDASNMLKPYLETGTIRFIGSTTYEEYNRHFSRSKGLVRRFQQIDIDALSLVLPQESDLALHASLHAALQKLPQDERELLLLSVLFGYNSRELAAMLETKEGTIRARLSRTKAKLRETLGEGEDEA